MPHQLFYLLLLMLVLQDKTFAQTKQDCFERFGQEQGLSTGQIYDLEEDTLGFLWLATVSGLFRYDGYSFKPYLFDPADTTTISDNRVFALLKDHNGNIWVGTDGGLDRFDWQKNCFVHYTGKAKENKIASITGIGALYQDSKQRYWIGTKHGLFRWDNPLEGTAPIAFKEEGKWADDKRINNTLRVFEDREGNIWAGTSFGLLKVNPEKGTFVRCLPEGQSKDSSFIVGPICQDYRGSFWLGTSKGLYQWNPVNNTMTPYPVRFDATGGRVMCLQIEAGKYLWIGTNTNGLFRLDVDDNSVLSYNYSPYDLSTISDVHVKSLLFDRAGNFWVGCFSGLNKRSSQIQKFPFYQPSSIKIPNENLVLRIHADQAGGVWMRARSTKLWYAEKLGTAPVDFAQKFGIPALGRASNFLNIGKDQVWLLGGLNMVYIYSLTKKTLEPVSLEGVSAGFRTIRPDPSDANQFWFVHSPGLARLDMKTRRVEYFNSKTAPSDTSLLYLQPAADDSTIWYCTQNPYGLGYFNKISKTFHPYQPNIDSLESQLRGKVRTMAIDKQGFIWIASNTGLLKLDPRTKNLSAYTKKNGQLMEDNLAALAVDAAGNIWFAGSGYISKLDRSEGEKFWYFPLSGENSPVTSSVCVAPDGRIFFGGSTGLNVVYPNRVRPDSIVPKVVLTGFNVLNRPKPLGLAPEIAKEITIEYRENVISFDFVALHFTNPQHNKYKYRLLGFADEWVDAGTEHRAAYTNLFWGRYEFQVLACNADGVWVTKPLSVRLTVNPPLWGTWWAFMFYAIFIFGGSYSFYKFRINRKLAAAETHRLQELDSVKTKLYTNITHEFRTPLTVILGETSQLEKHIPESQRRGLAAISRQGTQLLNLVNQMLDLAKVEGGSMRLNWVQGDVVLFLKYLLESCHSLAHDKQIELLFETDADEFWMDYDADKLRKITMNLLSNALKFTPKGGLVLLNMATDEAHNRLILRVSDNGVGIPPEKLPLIFNRFYQADDTNTRQAEGTGIGLTLTKELVHFLGGSIGVESRFGEGTAFSVTLPVTRRAEKQHFQDESFSEKNRGLVRVPKISEGASTTKKRPLEAGMRPHLLIIEDNPDVARYVSTLLAAEYKINVAPNGKVGLEAAMRLTPDLVISDVMMPEMDGFEACSILKTDVNTSHIPIILLTAKADMDSRIEGLEHGADAYLAKPFEERELQVQLRKLHELRQKLRERYSQPGLPQPSDLPAFRREDAFFKALHSVLEDKFASETFGVPELCDTMHMSRSNLFRKLIALTGKNIEDYLRSFRLHKAKETLRTSNLTVQEVAYDCGFKDPAHFTKAFRKEFGVLPSERRS